MREVMQLSNLECYLLGTFQFVYLTLYCSDNESKEVMI
jgi:hypothetical protein